VRLGIYCTLAAALALSGLLMPAGRRLAPRPAAYCLALGSLVAGVVWVGALGLLAVATVGRLSVAAAAGHWSRAVLEARDPVPVSAGVASLVVLAVVSVAVAASCRRLVHGAVQLVRLHVLAWSRCSGDVAIIDAATPEALALPGWHGRVLVSSGMLRALEPPEHQVLLAHERSHLRNGHWAFRLATRLGAALLPTLGPVVRRCDHALERWADEDAAVAVGDRTLTATAVAKAALATTEHHRAVLVPAFSDGWVAGRVSALLVPPVQNRWGVAAIATGLATCALVSGIEASRDLEGLFEAARHVGFR